MRLYPPVWILACEAHDQGAQRRLERRPTGSPVLIRPAARDQLTVPAQQRLRLDREARPGDPRHRATQRCQQRPVSPRQLRLPSLPTEHREFMAQHQDLDLLRATRLRQQPDEREQVPYAEIRERPEQAALLDYDRKSAELSQAGRGRRAGTSLRTLRLLHGIPYHGGFGASHAYTRDHSRHSFSCKSDQSDASRMRRETSRVSFLMCPSCVRVLLPDETTLSAIPPTTGSGRACGERLSPIVSSLPRGPARR